jgi:hypothetical protein
MLQTRTTAQVLAQLDSLAREVLWFWVRLEDGSLKQFPFSVRLLTWSCDCEGKNCACFFTCYVLKNLSSELFP